MSAIGHPIFKLLQRGEVLRCPIPCITSRRPCGSAFTDRIGRPQLLPHVLSEPSYYLRRGTFVVFDVILRPACKCNSGLEGIECKTPFVEAACAGCGEEGRRDDAACRLVQVGETSAWYFDDVRGDRRAYGFGDRNVFFAGFEERGDFFEDVVEGRRRELGHDADAPWV